MVEREIWPNMLEAARQNGVPFALVNARISEKSTRAYKLVRPLFTRLLGQAAFAALQTPEDARRYAGLGVENAKITVCGNVK